MAVPSACCMGWRFYRDNVAQMRYGLTSRRGGCFAQNAKIWLLPQKGSTYDYHSRLGDSLKLSVPPAQALGDGSSCEECGRNKKWPTALPCGWPFSVDSAALLQRLQNDINVVSGCAATSAAN